MSAVPAIKLSLFELHQLLGHASYGYVKRMIKDGSDVDRRDHVGRTPLQVAVLAKAEDVACDLIDAGARMTSRLVDGRTVS